MEFFTKIKAAISEILERKEYYEEASKGNYSDLLFDEVIDTIRKNYFGGKVIPNKSLQEIWNGVTKISDNAKEYVLVGFLIFAQDKLDD